MKHFKSNSLDIFGRAMIRRYEVSYYEYGLTEMLRKRFFLKISAYLYRMWLDYKYQISSRIEEIDVD